MATHARPGSLPSQSPAGRRVPELDPALVAQWQTGGGELIDLFAQARERLGGVAAFRLGPSPAVPTVLVTDPQAVQHVLALHPGRYVKRSHRARVLIGDGVLAATGEAWQRQRRLLQSQFTGRGMRRYEQRITEAARTTAARWAGYARTGEVFDVGDEMRRFALDTIWRSLTGHRLDPGTERELASVQAVVAALPSLPADGVAAQGAVAAELARIDAVASHAIAAARDGEAGPDGPGLLHVLLEAAGTRPEYTDRLIRDELVTLLVAGATEDDILAGYEVEAGTDVLVCPYLTHRDPGLWEDPGRFDPGRFTTPGRRPAHPGSYLPFGIGPRACLGLQFALRESTVLLEHLLPAHTPRFRSTPAKAAYSITVRPDGPTPATLGP
ncbi:cytochrome P450 [Streptomyces sp. ISL-44]|uniref:cytochrome P450 n=1 Tax=Streptomyces sp. ISL-44 TaxID=2819184 RepID=UPI001BEB10E8|nr:cytochrome P450 [Streptomyces sp. ISL-44]MBT2544177.1 cytochrome P450 [Streptomyces sp. ISL-44]